MSTERERVRRICDGVWTIETEIRPGGGLILPLRATLLRAADGRLSIVSPVAMSASHCEQVEQLGEVSHIIAPNRLHYAFFAAALAAFPQAQGLIAPGLAEKRPGLPASRELPGGLPEGIEGVLLEGADALSETVFLHGPSKTLVVTDLVFFVREPRNLVSAIILWLAGAKGNLAQSRALRFMTHDRGRAARSVARILDLDFDRLVMAHGEVVETDAKPALAAALTWMLGGAGPEPRLLVRS